MTYIQQLANKVYEYLPAWTGFQYMEIKEEIYTVTEATFSEDDAKDIIEENNSEVYKQVVDVLIFQHIAYNWPFTSSFTSIARQCFVEEYNETVIELPTQEHADHFWAVINRLDRVSMEPLVDTLFKEGFSDIAGRDNLLYVDMDSRPYYNIVQIERGSKYHHEKEVITWPLDQER